MSYACILAGGLSRRLGRDKVTLPWPGRADAPTGVAPAHGQALIARSVALVRAAGCTPLIAGGARADLASYATVVADQHPGAGPLAGIHAALLYAAAQPEPPAEQGRGTAVLCLAVDLPLMPVSFLRLLLDRAQRTGSLATVPFAGGAPQPLCAVYHTALAPGIAAALAAGDRKVMRVISSLTSPAQRDLFRLEAAVAAQPLDHLHTPAPHLWFLNLNTPSDLQRLSSATLDRA